LGCKPRVSIWRLYFLYLFLDGGFALFLESGSFKKKNKNTGKNSKFLPYIYIIAYIGLSFSGSPIKFFRVSAIENLLKMAEKLLSLQDSS
jgi:hypothetical protein